MTLGSGGSGGTGGTLGNFQYPDVLAETGLLQENERDDVWSPFPYEWKLII